MNYIILNDKNSLDIKGLLIQSLPPITKPLIRTSIDEIDGRDGDIITKLGYAAYDREISIGLYGDYDIDEVIAFFNSEGKVTFSNEDWKYYRYVIKDQIDFERLIRFKTATVTFHVQPFKYSLEEEPIGTGGGEFSIYNGGNTTARPKISITALGSVNIYKDSVQIFVVEMGDEETTIIIDTEAMEAYDESGILKNRLVSGDYDKLVLQRGENLLNFEGDIIEAIITNYNRWI